MRPFILLLTVSGAVWIQPGWARLSAAPAAPHKGHGCRGSRRGQPVWGAGRSSLSAGAGSGWGSKPSAVPVLVLQNPGQGWEPAVAAPLLRHSQWAGTSASAHLPAPAAGPAQASGRDRSPAGAWPHWRKMPAPLRALPASAWAVTATHAPQLSSAGWDTRRCPVPLQSPSVPLKVHQG